MKRALDTVGVLIAVGALGTLLVTAGPAMAQPYINVLTGEEFPCVCCCRQSDLVAMSSH